MFHMGEVGLLDVSVDPHVVGRDQADRAGIGERRGLRHQIGSGLQRVDLGDHAVEGGAHHRVLELALSSAIWNCLGSIRNSTSPAFTVWPSRTTTSVTMPETSVETISLAART